MSNLFISHTSALLYYRKLREKKSVKKLLKTNVVPTKYDSCKNCDILKNKTLLTDIEKLPIDILVCDKNLVHMVDSIKIHYSTCAYPNNSFLKIEENRYISSPELLVYQMSKILNMEKLMLMIMELCGSYSICKNNEQNLITNLSSITSLKKIKNFITKLNSVNNNSCNRQKVITALNNVADNSASPQESRFYIMLCGSHKLGGYNIKNMKLNDEIILSKKASQIACKEKFYLDISNVKTKVAIEYDSDMFHDNSLQNRKDKLRQDALMQEG